MTSNLTSCLLAVAAMAACSSSNQSQPAHPGAMSAPPPTVVEGGGQASGCPDIQLKSPDAVPANRRAKFTAILANGAVSSYNWTVTNGTIISGQHTSEITVASSAPSGSSVTATLEVGGLSDQCAVHSANASMLVGPPANESQP